MGIKQDYLKQSVNVIMQMYPNLNREDVTEIVRQELNNNLKDPTITIDNNVTLESNTTTLSELCNWIDREKPVVSGNATFYVQPEVLVSPASSMLRSLKRSRSIIKKQMFEVISEPDKYKQLDLKQANSKVVMNAEYGGSGAPTAAFYNKYSPPATTLMAQSIITTMAAFFEGFIGDNMKFYSVNECFDWMLKIQNKPKVGTPRWIEIPSLNNVSKRILSHFYQLSPSDIETVNTFLQSCSEETLIHLYYVNNLKGFISKHNKIKEIIRTILIELPILKAQEKNIPDEYRDKFNKLSEYNDYIASVMFMNPYSVPKNIENKLKELSDFIVEFCFVDYQTSDSIAKLNNHKRNTVLLVDTDSNVINADLFISFILDEIFPNETFGRERLYNDMICANILANILDKCIMVMLDTYGRNRNMGTEAKAELAMKNEFFFKRLMLMKTKKRYVSSIVLREGHIMIPFLTEIKGMDFIKAGVTDDVTDRFTKMLEDNILFPDEVNLHNLMKDLRNFEKEIYNDLKEGGTKYLRGQSYKDERAYKDPWAVQTFKAVTAWNLIVPENKIYVMDRIKLVKTTITNINDLEIIKENYPNEYKAIVDKIFNADINISNNLSMTERSIMEDNVKEIMRMGLKVIAIPGTMKKIPEWIIPLIDYQTIIADTCNSFRSVTDSFSINETPVKTANGKANLTSGLIAL